MIAAKLRPGRLVVLALSMALAWFVLGSTEVASETSNPDGSGSVKTIQPDSLPKLRIIRELQRKDHTFGVAWSSDSTKLAAFSSYGNLVTLWRADCVVLQEFHRPGAAYNGRALAFLAGNTEIATPPASNSSADIAFSIFATGTGMVVREVPGPHPEWRGRSNWATALVSSADQSLLAAAFGPSSQPVILYSTKDWNKAAEVPVGGPNGPTAIAFSANGRYLAIALPLDVLIYDVAARQVIQRIKAFSLEAGECCISAVAFSPDAHMIAVGTAAGPTSYCKHLPEDSSRCIPAVPKTPLRTFLSTDGSAVASYPEPQGDLWDMRWDPDGRSIAFVTTNALFLWNPSKPHERQIVQMRSDTTSLAFAPNERQLAVSNGNYVTIFEVRK